MEKVMRKLEKLPVFLLGALLLSMGAVSAVVITTLATAITSEGNVGAPFTAEIVAASVGTITPPNTLNGANTVAGSAFETMDINLTNNANQPVSVWLETSCGSADDTLTTDYMTIQYDAVAPQYTCDAGAKAYYYRTFAQEAIPAGITQTPQIGYKFPITPTGYFVGDYNCEVNLVTAKAC